MLRCDHGLTLRTRSSFCEPDPGQGDRITIVIVVVVPVVSEDETHT
jgi:hypothetical protein